MTAEGARQKMAEDLSQKINELQETWPRAVIEAIKDVDLNFKDG
jgi:hypothetical protein